MLKICNHDPMRITAGPQLPYLLRALAIAILVFWGNAWWANISQARLQDPPPPVADAIGLNTAQPDLDVKRINTLIEEIKLKTDIDEPTRESIVQAYQSAVRRIEVADQLAAQTAELNSQIQNVTQRLAELAEQRKLATASKLPAEAPASLEEHRQLLLQRQSELNNLKKQLTALQEEPQRRQTRLAEIPKLVTEKQAELTSAKQQLELPTPPGELETVTQARRMQLQAQELSTNRELQKLAVEQSALTTLAPLLTAQIEVLELQVKSAESTVQQLQAALQKRQESIAQRYLRETEEESQAAEGTDPRLRDLAQENVDLAEKYAARLEKQVLVTEQLREIRARLEEIERQFRTTQERVTAVGLTEALSLSLKKQKSELIAWRTHDTPHRDNKSEIQKLQIELFDLQDSLSMWQDEGVTVQREWERAGIQDLSAESMVEVITLGLVSRRTRLARELLTTGDQLFRNLIALDTEQRRVVGKINEFIEFIDERVIWSPSTSVVQWTDVIEGRAAVQWLIAGPNWQSVVSMILNNLLKPPYVGIAFGLLVLLVFVAGRSLKPWIREAGSEAKRGRCIEVWPTLQALVGTLLLSAQWPLFFAWISHLLLIGSDGELDFSVALGRALWALAIFLSPLEIMRQSSRQDGLGEAHFNWPEPVRRFFRLQIKGYYLVAGLALVVMFMMEFQTNEAWKNSLGRFAGLVLFLATAWYLHSFTRPQGPLFRPMEQKKSHTLMYRGRGLWHLLLIAIPITLFVLTAIGYFYTTFQLGARLELTAFLAVAMVVVAGVLLRWLLMQRRKMAIEEARKLRLQAMMTSPQESGLGLNESVAVELQEQPLLDLATVSQQAREVLMFVLALLTIVFLYFVWQDVLPALGILDRMQMWTVSLSAERIEVVSVQDLLYSLIVAGATFVIIRNLPGLLNLVFTQFSMLDAGARFAAITIIRYLITIVGAVTALNFLSIPWSQYSWLVAAATVGLGFGLQEIFANFVSGLIMLFERPVRVGDVVTVDNTTGIVTRIQMRATTIMNWDRQELIVPNKEFITGKLLNWTLTSQVNRLVLKVSVTYESDPRMVRELLTKVITSNAEVLTEPAPMVSFEAFGESALDFSIRCYLANLDRRIETRHELNSSINEALKNAGIGIPFPQREIRILK